MEGQVMTTSRGLERCQPTDSTGRGQAAAARDVALIASSPLLLLLLLLLLTYSPWDSNGQDDYHGMSS